MRKPIIAGSIRRYTFSVHSFIIRNGLFVLFCLLLFGGVLWGALNSRSADEELLKRLDFIFQTNYMKIKLNSLKFHSFANILR